MHKKVYNIPLYVTWSIIAWRQSGRFAFLEVLRMKAVLTVIHVIVCIALIAVVLMQHRKSGGFTGAFGSGTQADMSGNRTWQRMSGLHKATAGLIAAFMVLSILQLIIR